MAKILIIEDDSSLLTMIADTLGDENFVVETTENGLEGKELLLRFDYDAVILDWGLPEASGIEIVKELRAKNKTTPVLMLTGKDHIDQKVEGFESGVDDYLTKPFHMKELLSRLKSLLRRTAGSASDLLSFRYVTIDVANFKVTSKGKQVTLRSREFALLEYLMRHPGQVFSADALLNSVWTSDSSVGPETVRQCIKRIRKAIDAEDESSILENIYGVGYRLKEEDK